MIGLTKNQARVLDFIIAEMKEGRCFPTYNDIRACCGMKSRSEVNRVVLALEERGRIFRSSTFRSRNGLAGVRFD